MAHVFCGPSRPLCRSCAAEDATDTPSDLAVATVLLHHRNVRATTMPSPNPRPHHNPAPCRSRNPHHTSPACATSAFAAELDDIAMPIESEKGGFGVVYSAYPV